MQAIVIGATGLVGASLVSELSRDSRFSKVKLFARRPVSEIHPKCEVHVINFNEPHEWQHEVKGDVLFSCLGTTLKNAGGKEAQYKVDFTYQYNFALSAFHNEVPAFVLISSAGASTTSPVFYSKMKGELEAEILKLSFKKIRILRPGILAGNRKEKRPAEKIAIQIMKFISRLPGLNSYKPIDSTIVAKAMINSLFIEQTGVLILSPAKLFELGI